MRRLPPTRRLQARNHDLELRVNKRQRYRCTCSDRVDTALGPQKLMPGSRYSPEFAVHVAVDKYADGLALER